MVGSYPSLMHNLGNHLQFNSVEDAEEKGGGVREDLE